MPGSQKDRAPTCNNRFEAWPYRFVVHACYAEAKRSQRWRMNVRVLPDDVPTHDGTLSVA